MIYYLLSVYAHTPTLNPSPFPPSYSRDADNPGVFVHCMRLPGDYARCISQRTPHVSPGPVRLVQLKSPSSQSYGQGFSFFPTDFQYVFPFSRKALAAATAASLPDPTTPLQPLRIAGHSYEKPKLSARCLKALSFKRKRRKKAGQAEPQGRGGSYKGAG